MKVVRKGDLNNQGGKVSVTKQRKVFSNKKLIATKNDIVTYKNRAPTKTGNGSRKVFINGFSVNRVGDIDLDKSIRIQGDDKVKAG